MHAHSTTDDVTADATAARRQPRRKARRPARRGFTLVELLVVIGIIAVLISILLPAMGRARASAQSVKCMANLKQLGNAFAMYVGAYKGAFPYPTTAYPGVSKEASEAICWFNAVDPFLQTAQQNNNSGVAAYRNYKEWKQCLVYGSFEGAEVNPDGTQGEKGNARSYKMNTHMRRFRKVAKVGDIRLPSKFVMIGDGVSLDTGNLPTFNDSAAFRMDPNDVAQAEQSKNETGAVEAAPAVRHLGGANILFVDGHVENVKLPTIKKTLMKPNQAIAVSTWESEYITNAGEQFAPTAESMGKLSMQTAGIKRNPDMPLIWSEWGKLYRFAPTAGD